MGLFKILEKRKKRKNIEEFVEEEILLEAGADGEFAPVGKRLNCCEQLVELSRELEETKKEYRMVTDYLTDIQMIEDLPSQEMEKIQETAQNILSLNQKREDYSLKSKRLSDTQFIQLEQLADEMPDNIKRLQANERYQSKIKHDIDCLEGEKSEWTYYSESLILEKKYLKVGLWAILIIFIIGMSALFYIQYGLYRQMTNYILFFLLLAAVGGGSCILRLQNDIREQKRAYASINRAITLLNQMKTKYVNVTNAVDYACEKFHVNNSMELNYMWEQYMEEVKEREAAVKNNEDLEYFSKKLVRELKRYRLYDAAIWMHQANALVDKKEMVEVKHYLLVRRQKLRARIEQQVTDIQNAKEQLLMETKGNEEYQREITDVLHMIDEMCGL